MTSYSFPSVLADGITLIVGLGETGVAAARWCVRNGAKVRIADTRQQPAGLSALSDALDMEDIDVRLGEQALTGAVLDDVHTLVLSPGLAPDSEPVASLLHAARNRGIDIVGEIELFARALNDMRSQGYNPQLLAVTGTNGKTTVAAMTRTLAQACGHAAVAAGNIGPAALAALEDALITGELPQVWIIELSSFQLWTTRSLDASAAVVLNISPDHLDWHGSFDAYVQTKARLLAQARVRIINRDDPVVSGMVANTRAADVLSFGNSAPVFIGDLGLENHQAMAWICAARDDGQHDVPTRARKTEQEEKERPAGALSRLMPADAMRVRGRHNALNAQAAMILVRTLGGSWAAMLHALRDYAGEPHRMEAVRSIAGVEFINDSKGTNVGATIAALEGLDRPVVLIAGGLAKGQDFLPLARAAKGRARSVVLIGRDAPTIARILDDVQIPVHHADSMEHAVEQAFGLAQSGDVVLLSPACASMDMFKSYVQRGHYFVDHVNELALDHGEVA